jgi:hypothetical protein
LLPPSAGFFLSSFPSFSSTLKVETIHSSDMSVDFHRTTLCYIQRRQNSSSPIYAHSSVRGGKFYFYIKQRVRCNLFTYLISVPKILDGKRESKMYKELTVYFNTPIPSSKLHSIE